MTDTGNEPRNSHNNDDSCPTNETRGRRIIKTFVQQVTREENPSSLSENHLCQPVRTMQKKLARNCGLTSASVFNFSTTRCGLSNLLWKKPSTSSPELNPWPYTFLASALGGGGGLSHKKILHRITEFRISASLHDRASPISCKHQHSPVSRWSQDGRVKCKWNECKSTNGIISPTT